MDDYYDRNQAAKLLENYMEDIDETSLSHLFHDDTKLDKISVQYSETPKSWNLAIQGDGDTVSSLILTTKGIIYAKSLPPFDSEHCPKNVAKFRYMRQHVELVGMDVPNFSKAVESLGVIHAIFERQFPEGHLEQWTPKISSEMLAFESSNRLFTPSFDTDQTTILPFPRKWDTTGKLVQMASDKFQFCKDNLVYYFIKSVNKSMIEASPVIFRIGDVVEIQFTLSVVQVGKAKYRMMTTLRGLTLLDDSCSKRAALLRMHQRVSHIPISLPLKRKAVNQDDISMTSTNDSVSRMRIA